MKTKIAAKRIGLMIFIGLFCTLILNLSTQPAEAQAEVVRKFKALLQNSPIALTMCEQSPQTVCVASFGLSDRNTIISLNSPAKFPTGLKLLVNQQPFECKISLLDRKRVYCFGPQLDVNVLAQIDIYTADNQLAASGELPMSISQVNPEWENIPTTPKLYLYLPLVRRR